MSFTYDLLTLLEPVLAAATSTVGDGVVGDGAGGGGGGGGGRPAPTWLQLIYSQGPFILIMVAIFYFLIIAPARREKAKAAALLASLGRGATVRMAGGEIGKIVKVDDDTDTIVLKVDESNNTKIRYAKSAVSAVLDSKADAKPDKAEKTDTADRTDEPADAPADAPADEKPATA